MNTNWKQYNLSKNLKEILTYLIHYFKNPIAHIKTLPNWTWTQLIILILIFSSGSGALYGVISQSIINTILGFIILPITSLITIFVTSVFFYYFILIFKNTTAPFLLLFTLISLTSLPYFVFHTISSIVPIIDIIAFAFSGILLVVGLNEQFNFTKKVALEIVIVIYLILIGIWVFNSL